MSRAAELPQDELMMSAESSSKTRHRMLHQVPLHARCILLGPICRRLHCHSSHPLCNVDRQETCTALALPEG